MGRKKKEPKVTLTEAEVRDLQTEYIKEIEHDKRYSLEVDPDDIYGLSDEHKKFILNYVQFKSIAAAADLTDISLEQARAYFTAFSTQQEIRRINMGLYQRQFAAKMISMDQLGGYLTSLLTGENVPYADQLKTKDKIQVASMLIHLNELKGQALEDPSVIASRDIGSEIQNLSLKTIQRLLNESNEDEKKDLVEQLNNENQLTEEEKAYLKTLPAKDLLEMINKIDGGKK